MEHDATAYSERWCLVFAAKEATEGIMPTKRADSNPQPEPGRLYTPSEFAAAFPPDAPQNEHPPEAVAAWKAIEDAIEKTQQARADLLALASKRSSALTQAMYAGSDTPEAALKRQQLEAAVGEARTRLVLAEQEEQDVRVESNGLLQRLSEEKMARGRAEMQAAVAAQQAAQQQESPPLAAQPSALMRRLLGRDDAD